MALARDIIRAAMRLPECAAQLQYYRSQQQYRMQVIKKTDLDYCVCQGLFAGCHTHVLR